MIFFILQEKKIYIVCTWEKIICYNKHCTLQKTHPQHLQQNIAEKSTKNEGKKVLFIFSPTQQST